MNSKEKWKKIKGFDYYKVSNKGRVKSIDHKITDKSGRTMSKKGKILIPTKNKWGYNCVDLYQNGKRYSKRVNILVAEAFIPNPENKPEVNHIIPISKGGTDEASNLEWVTGTENMEHAKKLGLYKKNKDNLTYEQRKEFIKRASNACKRKVIMIDDETLGELMEFDSIKEAADYVGIKKSTHISSCCLGKRLRSGGYRWRYAE